MATKDYSGTPLSQKLGAKPGAGVVVFFTTSHDDLERRFEALKRTLDPADGLRRRTRDPDRIEAQDLGFHRRVRDAFRDLAAADPDRFAVVDAAAPVAEVAARVQAAVLALLEGSGEPQGGAPVGRDVP